MKKIIIFFIIAVLVSSGCVSEGPDENGSADSNQEQGMSVAPASSEVGKVEVFHFHGNHQCQSCIDVGKCAEDAIDEYFQEEKESGLVVFDHVNGELPENTDLVRKYGATGSSLWIGVYDKDGGFSKEQNINVWYKTSDMKKCREYIKGVIEEKLRG